MDYIPNSLVNAKCRIITDLKEWRAYLKKSLRYDIFHTFHYHTLDNRGEPMLFVYEEDSTFIAIPLLKRSIENADFFDFTSTYGYSGPISNKEFDSLDNIVIEGFKKSFTNFMEDNQAVSVFSRLNPFINQCALLDKIGGVRNNGKTIYIDLTQSLEEQRNRYDKSLIRQIRRLRNKDFQIKYANTQEEIRLFTNIYNKSMVRLSAHKSYFYDEEYFSSLINNDEFKCRLIAVYDGDEMICGAIIMWSDGIIRNHLTATSESYIKFSPSKLLIDEISIIGRDLGLRFLHLGGGLSGREDTLFEFKRSFSDLLLEDNIWCHIADQNIYNQLVAQNSVKESKEYFPLYRNV